MKDRPDSIPLQALGPSQRGVFSKADLQTALADPHPTGFQRRANYLEQHGFLRRYARGWYVREGFDLPTLSQRLAPESYVSFEWALSKALVTGPKPERRIGAVKLGKARTYEGLGYTVEHVSIAPHLFFGFEVDEVGVRYARPEKAALDCLYFHMRGRKYAFDLYSDITLERLDVDLVRAYLARFRNRRFQAFARDVLELGDDQ